MNDQPDPNNVMRWLTTEDCIDVTWAVLEGDLALETAIEIANERASNVGKTLEDENE